MIRIKTLWERGYAFLAASLLKVFSTVRFSNEIQINTIQKLLSRKSAFKHITLLCLGFPVLFLPTDAFAMLCASLKKIKFLVKTVISSPSLSPY